MQQRKSPVGTERPSGEDDPQQVEDAGAPRNRVPADGELSKTEGGKGSGRPAGKVEKGRALPP